MILMDTITLRSEPVIDMANDALLLFYRLAVTAVPCSGDRELPASSERAFLVPMQVWSYRGVLTGQHREPLGFDIQASALFDHGQCQLQVHCLNIQLKIIHGDPQSWHRLELERIDQSPRPSAVPGRFVLELPDQFSATSTSAILFAR